MNNPAMFDWNDLRFLLAVARGGSTTAAAKALGLSQSTVQRRVTALERRIGQPLVLRHASGYRLTPFAEALLPAAGRAEAAIHDIERVVVDHAEALAGVIRMTCPEPIVYRLTRSPFMESFRAQHPELRIDFVTSDRYLDLTRGDADLALRSGDTEDDLVGLKVADSFWAVYASRSYVERQGAPDTLDALGDHPLVGLDENMGGHRAVAWLRTVAPQERVVARSDSILGLLLTVKSGIGIGALPTALGDAEAELVRVLGPVPELTRSWRLLTTAELRGQPRIAAFFDFVAANRGLLKPVLSG